jgi:SAM-dependent methyltransferase
MIKFSPKNLSREKMQNLLSELQATGYFFKKENPTQLVRCRKDASLPPLVKLFGLGLPVLKNEVTIPESLLSELIEDDGLIISPFSISSSDNGELHLHDHWPPSLADDYIHLGQESFYLKEEINAVGHGLKNKLVLDLGCGQGLLGMTASDYGARVLGIDCSARSIELAVFLTKMKNNSARFVESTIGKGNHSLNEVTSFQKDEPLDLIVFNPPLVVSHSEDKVIYRDGGEDGTEILFLFLNFIKFLDFKEAWFICGDPLIQGKRKVLTQLKKESQFLISERRVLKEKFNQDQLQGSLIKNIELTLYKIRNTYEK